MINRKNKRQNGLIPSDAFSIILWRFSVNWNLKFWKKLDFFIENGKVVFWQQFLFQGYHLTQRISLKKCVSRDTLKYLKMIFSKNYAIIMQFSRNNHNFDIFQKLSLLIFKSNFGLLKILFFESFKKSNHWQWWQILWFSRNFDFFKV